jgi:hypothetical protein
VVAFVGAGGRRGGVVVEVLLSRAVVACSGASKIWRWAFFGGCGMMWVLVGIETGWGVERLRKDVPSDFLCILRKLHGLPKRRVAAMDAHNVRIF